MTDMSWDIRTAREGDLEFIYSTWMKSYRYDSMLGCCRNSIFFPEYSRVIDNILSKKQTSVRVACDKNDSELLFGYSVTEPDIIHYAFVKKAFCGLGIARSLLGRKFSYASHKTESMRNYFLCHEIDYNPFILFKRGIESGT
jgi:hypothetical protein